MQTGINRKALFCDGTADYVDPPQPQPGEVFTLRFRTQKNNVDEVRLITEEGSYPLKRAGASGDFEFFEIRKDSIEAPFSYAFQLRSGEECCIYNQYGVLDTLNYHVNEDPYAFRIVPGFSTPDWTKGAVMYQIFVDRFCNGDPDNDVQDREYVYIGRAVQGVKRWEALPEASDVHRFYGGDLSGVREKLDYLQELGVEVVYFNPLFVSPSNHKYDSQDYDYIDPHFGKIVEDGGRLLEDGEGSNRQAECYQKRVCSKANLEASNQLFAELVREMHSRGMRVIVDGVFNHCGSFHKWMDREELYQGNPAYPSGAYIDRKSPYHDYFGFQDDTEGAWPYNASYEGWWGHSTLPKLNYENSRELEDEMIRIGRKWVSEPYCVDGWRLDVAADLGHSNEFNHEFWKRFRREVKEANPEAFILAEHYGDPSEWLQGDEWDSIMNYDGFMEPVTWFLTGMEKHSDERRDDLYHNADYFVRVMRHNLASMLTPSLQTAMNELSNHDHSRFLTRTNRVVGRIGTLGAQAAEQGVDKSVMRLAVVMQMTWPGAPTIYYGDEVGLCGFTDPDSRRTYPWGREDRELLECHRALISIHRNEQALREGSILFLEKEGPLLAYARFQKGEQVIVALNSGEKRQELQIPAWRAGVPENARLRRLFCSYKGGFSTEYDEYLSVDGTVVLNLGACSAVILKTIRESEHEGNVCQIYFGEKATW